MISNNKFECQPIFLQFRHKQLKFARSTIHGWGLFAVEDVQPNELIIEYVGELIRSTVADAREVGYTKRGIGSSYLFRLDADYVSLSFVVLRLQELNNTKRSSAVTSEDLSRSGRSLPKRLNTKRTTND